MPKINLAQEAIRAQVMARRRRMIYALSVGVLTVVLGAYGLLFFLTSSVESKTADVENEVTQLQAQLDARKDDVREIVLFRERLKNLQTIFSSRALWSRLLDEVEKLTTPDATFSKFQGDVETRELEAALLVPSIDAAADLLASYQNRPPANPTVFSDVTAKSLTAAEVPTGEGDATRTASYRVSLQLKAEESAFRPPPAAGGPSSAVPSPTIPPAGEGTGAESAPAV
jgi:hypothetical protein